MTSPFTLLDIKFPPNSSDMGTSNFLKNDLTLCYLSTTVGGTITTLFEKSRGIYTISGQGTFTSQSRKYCVYQPGKSLLMLFSGILNYGNANTSTCTTRIGYFDDSNGFFFQLNNSVISIVLRNESINTSSIPQNLWNIDTMDGNGPSSITLDFSNTQLFAIDLEWLGVGQIRFGFFAYGRLYYCHQITNLNELTAPYSITASLPVRYQISTSSNGANGSMMQICSTVISEGGYNPNGKPFSIADMTGVAVSGTEIPLLAITGITNYNHENVIPTSFTLMDISNNNGYVYRIRYYPSPADIDNPINVSTNVDTESVVAYALNANMKSPFLTSTSVIVDQGVVYGRGSINTTSLSNVFNNICQITKGINNKTDVIVFSAQKLTGGGAGTVFSSLAWQEIY